MVFMKKDIHPQYFPKAKVNCACGNKFTVGSTKQEIQTEICHQCHPFYTGKAKLIDTAGRVEKFKTRRARAKDRKQKLVNRNQKLVIENRDQKLVITIFYFPISITIFYFLITNFYLNLSQRFPNLFHQFVQVN